MKVLLLNGSPHKEGCTYTALKEIENILNEEGIETEIFNLGTDVISGCRGCGACRKIGKCVIDDKVNGEIVHLTDRLAYFEGKTDEKDILNLANTINHFIENKKMMDKYNKKALLISDSRNKDKIISCWKKEIEMMNSENN